jgi:NAD(P)-dependent dehydrogenase (short-subunit alcohol dehydrogenase family)
MKLQDKVAVITGGSAGIGAICARVFGKHGSNVVIGLRGQEAGHIAVVGASVRGLSVFSLTTW